MGTVMWVAHRFFAYPVGAGQLRKCRVAIKRDMHPGEFNAIGVGEKHPVDLATADHHDGVGIAHRGEYVRYGIRNDRAFGGKGPIPRHHDIHPPR